VDFENDHYFSYRAQINFNSEDDWNFPTRGARFEAGYAYVTDNFAKLNGNAGISDVSANWRKSFLFGSRFTFQPMFYGRLLFGSELPHIFGNIMGGDTFGHYVEQQLPFAGLGHVEYAERHIVAVRLQAQQRMGSNNYVLFRASVAQHADELKHILETKTLWGGQLAYYYKTMFGPLGATLGYASRTKTPYFYINLGYVF
jgi:NTE family protein